MPHGRQNYIEGHSRWKTPLSRNVLRYQKGSGEGSYVFLVEVWRHLSGEAVVEKTRMVG